MDRRRLIIGIVVGVLVVGAIGVGAYYYTTNATARDQLLEQLDIEVGPVAGEGLLASGFIEAEEVEVATEMGGRVIELPVEEGDNVAAGDRVVQLDISLLEAERDMYEAQLTIMEAQYDLYLAYPREEAVRVAEAQVAIAQATLAGAKITWQDALAMAGNPQEIEIQLVDAQTQLSVAQEQLAAAQIQLEMAERQMEIYDDLLEMKKEPCPPRIPSKYCPKNIVIPWDMAMTPQRYEEAWINLNAAAEAVNGAQALMQAMQNLANNPAAMYVQAAEAEQMFETAEASVERALAELAVSEAGVRDEDLAVAEAAIAEAEAALAVIDAQIERMSVYAPIGGVVLEQSIHVGELAVPNAPLVTIANLDVVELTVYISETQFDKVSLNQRVTVTVDSFPDRTFEGVVIHIADEAEFTPRSVQTREERVNLVYAIKIRIENPDHALKPGMPADALFEE